MVNMDRFLRLNPRGSGLDSQWVRLSEKLGMRSIILSRLELELKSESSNIMDRT